MYSYDICTSESLKNSSCFASIAHAIMMSRYPDFSYEQSWDCKNYSFQDGAGTRGTISFSDDLCVCAIRDESSDNIYIDEYYRKAFLSAPDYIQKLAKNETLQYLLDEDRNGVTAPVITVGFWCDRECMYSNIPINEMQKNGFAILQPLIMKLDDSFTYWQKYYEMNDKEITWLKQIYNLKTKSMFSETLISINQISDFDKILYQGECKQSFDELNIVFTDN